MTVPTWPQILGKLTTNQALEPGQASWAMDQIMTGTATPAQIAAFGVAMKMKRPTSAEVTELADIMLKHARRVPTDDEERRATGPTRSGVELHLRRTGINHRSGPDAHDRPGRVEHALVEDGLVLLHANVQRYIIGLRPPS